jgi:hypothetical protein
MRLRPKVDVQILWFVIPIAIFSCLLLCAMFPPVEAPRALMIELIYCATCKTLAKVEIKYGETE